MTNLYVAIGIVALALGAMFQAGNQPVDDRYELMRARALGMSVYWEHCATCHGLTGRGDGSRIAELKTPPGDLTKLSERNGWTFPTEKVARVIDGADRTHRDGEMPLWGKVFQSDPALKDDAAVKDRIRALTLYLEFFQLRQYRR